MSSRLDSWLLAKCRTLVIVVHCWVSVESSKTNITIGALFPMGGTWDAPGILPGVEMALEHINANDDILPDYTLQMEWKNSECDAGVGMKSFFELLYEEPVKIMLLGAACSVVSQPVAATAQHWNLVQISYASASDALSNKERYTYFFRTYPPDSAVNAPRIEVFKQYGWTKVSTIHQTEELFSFSTNLLITDLERHGIELITSEIVDSDSIPTHQLSNIKAKDGRIIVVNMYEDQARILFCEAYKLGMYGPKYMYFILGWYIHEWWLDTSNIDCTTEQLIEVIELVVGMEGLQLDPGNVTTVSGMTPSEYLTSYHQYLNGTNPSGQVYASYGYDSMWSIALSLHSAAQQLTASGSGIKIEDFDYDNTHGLRDIFMDHLRETNFHGVSGPISFDDNGDRFGITKIEQLRIDPDDGELRDVTLALYYPQGSLVWLNADEKLLFRGDDVPLDSAQTVIVKQNISLPVYVVCSALASLGVLLALGFLYFNVTYRKRKLIKLSSPKMNNVIAFGCVICYVSVFLFGVDGALVDPEGLLIVCRARIWSLCLGFTLAFGGLFSKTWRVYVIFTNATKKKRIIRDYHLFITILILLSIDVVILTVWMAVDPPQRVIRNLTIEYDLEGDDVIKIPQLECCQSVKYSPYIWLGLIYSVKMLLLLYGARLAWETRKVTIPELNDSKFIGLSIYNVTTLCIIGVPISAVLGEQVTVAYCLVASFILFCTTITLLLVFFPKIISLRSSPPDEALRITTIVNHKSIPTGNNKVEPGPSTSNESEKIAEMTNTILSLKTALRSKDEEISAMRKRVDQLTKMEVTDEISSENRKSVADIEDSESNRE
ncbi:gamma-aminobutyric acid type B receptor subunit 2-like isoform X2 [Ptychodera flava]